MLYKIYKGFRLYPRNEIYMYIEYVYYVFKMLKSDFTSSRHYSPTLHDPICLRPVYYICMKIGSLEPHPIHIRIQQIYNKNYLLKQTYMQNIRIILNRSGSYKESNCMI